MRATSALLPPLLALAAAALTACGGGGGGADASVQSAQLQGTAATGAALANAQVQIVNAAGQSPCVETSITTSATGSYTCTLKAGEAAPFFVSVLDPAGMVKPLVSVATATPASGGALVVNATPLTTAIVGQLTPDRDAQSVFNAKAVDATALAQVTRNVLAQIAPVLSGIDAPAGYDPFSTRITAASSAAAGNTADLVLDVLVVGADAAGNTTLGTVDNPAGVAMATAAGAGATLAAAPAAVAALSIAARTLSIGFEQCYALPVAQRVLAADASIPAHLGGPKVTSAHARCAGLTDAAFLHQGYSAGQLFHGLLTSEAMTGARFSVPEVMHYSPTAQSRNGRDSAVLNFRYLDAAGQPGHTVVLAVNMAAGGAAPSWVLLGDQAPVDIAVRSTLSRLQHVGPAKANLTQSLGEYASGIEFFVRKDGPGSAGLTTARVTGPGLPAAGLMLNRPLPAYEAQQSWLNIVDKRDVDPAEVATRQAASGGSVFWLARTQDLAGSGATTLADNPNASTVFNTSMQWAHPLDYGAPLGQAASLYVPFAELGRGASYKIELFYDGSATPRHTVYKTLLTPVIPATRGSAMAWNTPGADLLALVDVTGGTLAGAARYEFTWTQNPVAEQVGSTQMFSSNNALVVNQGVPAAVARGVTRSSASAPDGAAFATLDSTARSARSIVLNYRSFDGAAKRAVYAANY
ncbi:hypothetical protein [Aquabacterium sp. OR-4]|uniref:hypothetical protein n=1 Tax=Aquabacterium sp. OR-4 TaxID=2978127 RepID=UPI0021B24F7F|nr:hypothetical protein [Aquabacterium sp. OR-4]MDT7837619.1 hypothetical protein [Aquabacterium sp. OR-4]